MPQIIPRRQTRSIRGSSCSCSQSMVLHSWARIKLLGETFLDELLQGVGVVELPWIGSLRLGIARRDILEGGFDFRGSNRRYVSNIPQHIALERAREKFHVGVARVFSQHTSGEVRICLRILDPLEGRL